MRDHTGQTGLTLHFSVGVSSVRSTFPLFVFLARRQAGMCGFLCSLSRNDSPPAHREPHVPVAGDDGIHAAIYRCKGSILFSLSTHIPCLFLLWFLSDCERTIERVN